MFASVKLYIFLLLVLLSFVNSSTLTICDWDDSLFPTTDMYVNKGVNQLDNEFYENLNTFLSAVKYLGEVAIVTASRDDWVAATTRDHLLDQDARDLLGSIKVVYAMREEVRSSHVRKSDDFDSLIHEYILKEIGNVVVSISDSTNDVLDFLEVCRKYNQIACIAIKLLRTPSAVMVDVQLRLLATYMEQVVRKYGGSGQRILASMVYKSDKHMQLYVYELPTTSSSTRPVPDTFTNI